MTPYLETAAVLALALASGALGLRASRARQPWRTLGAIAPLAVVCLVAVARRRTTLVFVPPFSYFTPGRTKFVVLAAAIAMMFSAAIPLTRPRRKRVMLWVFTCLIVAYSAVPPFLGPVFCRGHLSALRTEYSPGGVCLQTTRYTCGPAAAVTALASSGGGSGEGVRGDESAIALRAGTTPVTGTDPDMLVLALEELYGESGVECVYRPFASVDELAGMEPVIALTRFALLVDHYVTVLEVTPVGVVVGDPLRGRTVYSRDEFARIWRHSGIVVRRCAAGGGRS